MNHIQKVFLKNLLVLGFNPLSFITFFRGIFIYLINLLKLIRSINFNKSSRYMKSSSKRFGMPYLILNEFDSKAGITGGHYFHQDLYVANLIYNSRPKVHLDIGSRIDGFISHLLSFEQNIVMGDIRENDLNNKLIKTLQVDLLDNQIINQINSFESVSCLHAIEHIGLGRYGDRINSLGHYIALNNLIKLTSNNGLLYLSHPTSYFGRIEYNAHRVIPLEDIYSFMIDNNMRVEKFSYIKDNGDFEEVLDINTLDFNKNYNLDYGCAVWAFRKLADI